ncbi:MAG TPA: SO_0444 family Cu/Zn efflux transporter [Candidatus Rifleibacterium sp.]|nr:SO_0444 family Cu/Zn efflux transporter [Candidatus Rifleibacterium sp.]HPT46402.1 SO_0444 family Cu/Zn efflux transporter [Candidatus Rifleibacterium sp.]
MDKFLQLLESCWTVLAQMSPYLLLGFIISGILSVLISPRLVEKHLGTGRFSSVFKASLLGVPLPLCSCGVIPVAASLRQHGASKGATTAFLISTPQTGVDSIMATWGLLGPVFAIFRPLAALLTGIVGGLLVSFTDQADNSKANATAAAQPESALESLPSQSIAAKFRAALAYAFVTLPGDISQALVIGVLISGVISTFISGPWLSDYIGNYYLTMLLMAVIGIPLYVCSTASIPIALAFIGMGVTPGAAFVFLISGPATNAAAISVIWKLLGRASAIIYLVTIFVGSMAGGLLLDLVDQKFAQAGLGNMVPACHTELSSLETGSAIFMLAIIAYAWYRSRKGPACCSACQSSVASSADLTLIVEGMSCNKCAEAVQRAILEIGGISSATVLLNEKRAYISGHAVNPEVVVDAIKGLGYSAKKVF